MQFYGLPLSGRVDLEAECSTCSGKGYEMVSGWCVRSKVLKARSLLWQFKPATMEELFEKLALKLLD